MTLKEQFIEDFCMDESHEKHELTELFDKYFKESPTGWISVKERLPAEYIDVLMAFEDEWQATGFYENGNWFNSVDSPDQDNWVIVTHWMPLPPLPTPPEK